MTNKLMYTFNYDTPNYSFKQWLERLDKLISQRLRNHYYKTLETSVINRLMTPPSLLCLAPSYRCLFTPTTTLSCSTWQYQKISATWRIPLNPSLYHSIFPPLLPNLLPLSFVSTNTPTSSLVVGVLYLGGTRGSLSSSPEPVLQPFYNV